MRRWLVLLVLALTMLGPMAASAQTHVPRIAFVSIHLTEYPNLARAAAVREAARVKVDLYGLGGGLLPSVEGVDLEAYDLVLLDGSSGPRLINFKPQLDRAKAATKLMTVDGDSWIQGNVDPAAHPDVEAYWKNATEENFARLYGYLRVRVLGGSGEAKPPVVYPAVAFHHPDAPSAFATRADYEAWAAGRLVISSSFDLFRVTDDGASVIYRGRAARGRPSSPV
jgi:cobaltochelatase CobN